MPDSQTLAQMQELARIGYEVSQRKPVDPPALSSPVQPHPITGVIPFTEQDRAWLTQNADGSVGALPGAPADILQRYHANHQGQIRFLRELASNPDQIILKLLEPKLKEMLASTYQERAQQTEAQKASQAILERHSPWMYEQAGGKPAVDFRGNRKLTPNGEVYMGFVEQLFAGGRGITDPIQLDQYATQMLKGHLAEQNLKNRVDDTAAKAKAIETPPVPQNFGPVAAPAPTPGPHRSLRDIIQAEALAQGVSL